MHLCSTQTGCGCLSDSFVKAARINHFCCLQQCNEPEEYARRMRALAKYHCRDIHERDGGECGFYYKKVCTCKKCPEDEEPKCDGEPYKTKNVLKCDHLWIAYMIECDARAQGAEEVIHPTLERGHSNWCEAHFTVLP